MIQRLRRMARQESTRELVRFGVVGIGGVIVNNGLLFLFHDMLGWPLVAASVVAVEASIVNNFVWNDRWTFSGRERTSYRFLRFNLISLGGLAVNTVTLLAVVALTGLHYLIANLIAIGVATGWNFVANSRWTWRRRVTAPRRGKSRLVGELTTEDVVVIPTYNEAENIDALVNSILGEDAFGILIVDDESPDGTGAMGDVLAEANPGRVAVLHRPGKDGLGAAYRAGFARALTTTAKRFYQMDADFSHDPATLVELRRRLLEDRDLVIGSRYVDGGSVVGWPFWRLVLSRAGSLYAGTILGLKVGDLTGGFKGWTRPALEAVRVEGTHSDGYAFQIEITYRAVMAGALVDEVPIRFAERERGVSKMGPGIVLEAVRRVPGFKVRKPEVGRVGTGVRMRS